MALVGGGGAGNVAGSNPSGTGTSLNYIGDHAYATSGKIGVANTEVTMLQFSTGSEYVVATVTFAYNGSAGDDYLYRISFDSQVIDEYHVNGGSNAPDRNPRQILIPPYTNVIVSSQNTTDSSSNDQTVVLVGRVYA